MASRALCMPGAVSLRSRDCIEEITLSSCSLAGWSSAESG